MKMHCSRKSDPNHHCCACKETYSNRQIYHVHLRQVREMKVYLTNTQSRILKLKNTPIKHGINSTMHCRRYDTNYSTQKLDSANLLFIHDMTVDGEFL